MAVPDATLDLMLDIVADNGTRLDICSQAPTTYAEATSTYTLGNVTLTASDGGGDWTIGNGDTSGRKLTLGAQTVNVTGSGTATHYAITNGSSTLYLTGTMTNVATSGSGTQDTNAVDVFEIRDPA